MFLSTMLFFSCSPRLGKDINQQVEKMEKCRKVWTYKDILKEQKLSLKVILFDKRDYRSAITFPAFVIGVTSGNDTVGVIDKSFEANIEIGEKVIITNDTWRDIDTIAFVPALLISKDEKRNDLYCVVKVVYRAKINKNK